MAEDVGDEFPAMNNITVPGILPCDWVPASSKSRTLPEAHFKSLRLYRKWCRYTPFIINWTGMRTHANIE
jgi:hypothetical protein